MAATTTTEGRGLPGRVDIIAAEGPTSSAVSWGAIFAGAFAMAATAVVLIALGTGFGLASVSPWPGAGVSATTFGVMTAIWLIVVQWISSGLGGYVAGRLRTRWSGLHADEVLFRDTAHGFLAWAVAAVLSAAVLVSGASSLIGSVGRSATAVVASAAQGAVQGGTQAAGENSADPTGYLLDTMFRRERPDVAGDNQEARSEASRILLSSLRSGDVPAADKTYLAQLIAARTGISQEDAQKRVDEVIAKAKEAEVKTRQAANAARKAGVSLSLFTGFSMLIGAFIAAATAALGGRQRDEF